MRLKSIGITMLFLIMASGAGWTIVERELVWPDLIPKSIKFDDPFAALEREDLEYLGFVARVRSMTAAGKQVSQETLVEVQELQDQLAEKGIDIDGLLAQRNKVRELRKEQASAVVESLNASSIKIPGYLLPLEYSSRDVTEFLLVPWIGACIHTPPPPPNQIVHVVLDKDNGYESRSIYEPVWVSGEIFTQATTRNLYLKDGAGDISIGYKMMAKEVVKYE